MLGRRRAVESGGDVPAAKQPLDAGFVELPERLLAEYRTSARRQRAGPHPGGGQAVGRAWSIASCVLGIGGSYMGARALFESCCHPYHNELTRGQRGGHPRMYFEGNNVDNDALQGCSTCWAAIAGRECRRPLGRRGHQQERRHAGNGRRLSQLLGALLNEACSGDRKAVAELVVPVTGPSGQAVRSGQGAGLRRRFFRFPTASAGGSRS